MKKCISLALALLVALAPAAPAFGAEAQQSAELEKAIRKVKSVITIPAEYKEFTYSSYQSGESGDAPVWDLSWSGTDEKNGVISAAVDGLGNLLSYYWYETEDDERSGLAKVTREEAGKTALAFLAKAMPDTAKDMRLAGGENQSYTSPRLEFTYQLYVDGIPAPFIQAEIQVNKYSGRVISFRGVEAGTKLPQFPKGTGSYTREQMEKIYEEKLGPELSYYIWYDRKAGASKVFAAYAMNRNQGKAIDAATGQVVDLYVNYNVARDAGAMGGGSNKLMEEGLTPEEKAALQDVSNLISAAKAESILRDRVEGIGDQEAVRTRLNQDYEDKTRFSWSISFSGASGSVDAKTGELLSFYLFQPGDGAGPGKALNAREAKAKTEAFIRENSPDKFEKSKEKEWNPSPSTTEEPDSFSFRYVRQEQGVGVDGDGFFITVDAKSGRIVSYSCNWHKNASFPAIGGAMDSWKAFQKFNETGALGPAYKMTGKNQVALVYDFANSVSQFLLEPFTGEKLSWNGQRYREETIPDYSDLKGHWAEKMIRELRENGYYLDGTQFKPDMAITQESFLRYLFSPMQARYNQDDFYDILKQRKIVLPQEKAPDQPLSRQDAAKLMVRYLGFETVAAKEGIFTNLYKDETKAGYKGYAAICNGLGIMKGDEKGRFNGASAMTRAEAASAIYRLLSVV